MYPESDNTIATRIRQWRKDLVVIANAPVKYRVSLLCSAWNWATSPSALRTDRENSACRRFARRCNRELARLGGWREFDYGYRWIDLP